MLLTPRYGPTAIIALDGDPTAIAQPCIWQRRRFLAMIQDLDEDEWIHPSRCDGWSSRDVAAHLASTNAFWEFAIRSGIDGSPTEMLATFDPVATPARMVADSTWSTDEIVETFATSSESLARLLLELDATDWTAQAEAPPGHLGVSAVVHHALWDSWIHERDIALPLGRTPPVESDEVIASLRYVAALTPALAIAAGASGTAEFDVRGVRSGCALPRRGRHRRARDCRDRGIRVRAHRQFGRPARGVELSSTARTGDSAGARLGLRGFGHRIRPLNRTGAGVPALRGLTSLLLCS